MTASAKFASFWPEPTNTATPRDDEAFWAKSSEVN